MNENLIMVQDIESMQDRITDLSYEIQDLQTKLNLLQECFDVKYSQGDNRRAEVLKERFKARYGEWKYF